MHDIAGIGSAPLKVLGEEHPDTNHRVFRKNKNCHVREMQESDSGMKRNKPHIRHMKLPIIY
jgi:hypothetical protein